MDFRYKRMKERTDIEVGNILIRIKIKRELLTYPMGVIITKSEWVRLTENKDKKNQSLSQTEMTFYQLRCFMEQCRVLIDDSMSSESIVSVIEILRSDILSTKNESKNMLGNYYLSSYMQMISNKYENGDILKKRNNEKASAYHRVIRRTKVILERYEADINRRIVLEDVNLQFKKDIVIWMNDSAYATNTIASFLRVVRRVMGIAYANNLTKSKEFKNSEFTIAQEKADNIYLTMDQIEQMNQLDISTKEKIAALISKSGMKKSEKQERLAHFTPNKARTILVSRDIFIIGCLTGQRVSDYGRLNSEMVTTINERQFFKIKQKKTDKTIYIPLDRRVKAILDRYNGKLPDINPVFINRYIKWIGEILGWTWNNNFDKDSKRSEDRFCDLICTHTARRSFATNAYKSGIPLKSIMAITGHGSEEALREYLKLNVEDKAVLAAKAFAEVNPLK